MTKKADVVEIKRGRGTKRTCQNSECGARFYDLDRAPIICPVCASPYVIPTGPAPLVAELRKPKRVEYRIAEETPPETAPPDPEAALEDAERDDQSAGEEEEPVLEVEDDEGGDVSNIIGGPLDEKEA